MAQIDLGKVVGRSAYELAVENGFEGTEQEWLASLHGEKGDPGQDAENYQVLATKEEVQGNVESGKLVDALVIKEVFQSVSDGKGAIASAITDKGVQTGADASFAVMAENIGQIQNGGGGGEDTSPHVYKISHIGAFLSNSMLGLTSYFSEKNIKKIIIKDISITGKKGLLSAPTKYITVNLRAKKNGALKDVYNFTSKAISSTSYTSTEKSNIEIDLSEYDGEGYISFDVAAGSSSGNVHYYEFVISGEVEVYF